MKVTRVLLLRHAAESPEAKLFKLSVHGSPALLAGEVTMIYQRAEQKGSGAATDFLKSSWLRRVLVLFPASHPWLEVGAKVSHK